MITFFGWLAIVPLAAIGHVAFWLDCFRRFAASNVPCRAVTWLERWVWLACASIPLALLIYPPWTYTWPPTLASQRPWSTWYLAGASAYGLWRCCRWTWERVLFTRPQVQPDRSRLICLDPASRWAGHRRARVWLALPGNEVCHIELNEKRVELPGLSPNLDGLVILHLSDLHMHRQWQRAFFEEVAVVVSQEPVDVVCLTGDLVESSECLDWLAVWSDLRPAYGTYFVLGNHDRRAGPVSLVRRKLESLGWISLGGRTLFAHWRNEKVVLAGNEEPWLGPKPSVDGTLTACALSMALLHTPDQFPWARRLGFRLVLAGHTHGGQVCIPGLGPLVVPCHTGTRYAAGLYYEDGSVLHVSRGLSSLHLVRYGCCPEISRLVLRTNTAVPGNQARARHA